MLFPEIKEQVQIFNPEKFQHIMLYIQEMGAFSNYLNFDRVCMAGWQVLQSSNFYPYKYS